MMSKWALPIISLAFGLAAGPAWAQVTDLQKLFSMLCVADKGIGFDWKNDDWVQASYKEYKYIVSKLGDQDRRCVLKKDLSSSIQSGLFGGTSTGCYEIKQVGEAGEADTCSESWDKTTEGFVLSDIECRGLGQEYRARVDGPFVLTRTYAAFATIEKRDSLVLQIGNCSLLCGP